MNDMDLFGEERKGLFEEGEKELEKELFEGCLFCGNILNNVKIGNKEKSLEEI